MADGLSVQDLSRTDLEHMIKDIVADKAEDRELYNIQRASQRENLRATTLSNLSKAHHDVMMNIASNMK